MKITCRCPPGLVGVLPAPAVALGTLPQWLRSMPARVMAADLGGEIQTLKQCPPFIDALGAGILLPLACAVEVADGRFRWDWPEGAAAPEGMGRSPLSFHVPEQATGSPLFDPGQFIVKFVNFWTLATEPGVSLLVTHPLNRTDLPFQTLSGIVDTDRYGDGLIHFPALWRDPGFTGRLEAGTPVAQCIPFRRETLELDVGAMDEADKARLRETREAVATETGVYRKRYRSGPG